MFLTPGQVIQAIANRLSIDPSQLPSKWQEIANSAQSEAYNQIVEALTVRGFTLAQILSWDAGPVFERDLSVYRALVNGGAVASFDPITLARMDRSKELVTTAVFVGGVYLNPGQPSPGQAAVGAQDTSSCFGPPRSGFVGGSCFCGD